MSLVLKFLGQKGSEDDNSKREGEMVSSNPPQPQPTLLPTSALVPEGVGLGVGLGVVTPSVQRRARFDPAIESGLLASPSLFKKTQPRPRLLPVEKRTWTYPGGAAAAAAAITSGATSLTNEKGIGGEGGEGENIQSIATPMRPPQVLTLDDYLNFVGRTYYPDKEDGAATSDFSILRRTTLGLLNSPVRVPTIIEKWAPIEIARFESAICLVGKSFAQVSKAIGTKTTSEVIEFYYLWKQSKNYQTWKRTFRAEDGYKPDF